MKTDYITPEIELLEMAGEDVLTSSGSNFTPWVPLGNSDDDGEL